MTKQLRTILSSLLLAGVVIACADHQLPPSAPLRLRLKTITNFKEGNLVSREEFNYDAGNREVSFTNSYGDKGILEYDDQNRYKFYRFTNDLFPSQNETTVFAYNTTNNNFQVYIGVRQQRDYQVDINKRILGYMSFQLGSYQGETYTYTGDNITTEEEIQGRTSSSVINQIRYEYDMHPNPYYGLIGYNIDDTRRLNRNNITKVSINGSVGTTYVYEYNVQGLPIKVKQSGGSADSTFETNYTYESY